MKLEEILNIIDVSDDDVETADNSDTFDHKKLQLDYSQIISDFFSDTTSDDSDSLGITDTESTSVNHVSNSTLEDGTHTPLDDARGISQTEILSSPKSSEGGSNDVVNKDAVSSNFYTGFREKCQCDIDTKELINNLCKSCGPLFGYVKYGVETKLYDWNCVRKLHFIHNARPLSSSSTPVKEKPSTNDTSDLYEDEMDVSNIYKVFLKSLGLPYVTLEEDIKSKLEIKFRHTLSKPLEDLKIFEDGVLPLENIHYLDDSESNAIISCMASSTDSLIIGTTSGSIFITDLSSYNIERQFCSYNEHDSLDYKPDPAIWYEIDSQKDVSVTSLDILPSTNWAVIGYSNGTVKLIQNSKTPWVNKTYSSGKGEEDLGKDDGYIQQSNSRSLGLMANAVSSAFSGLKKSTHAVCSTRVFDNAVLISKFTFDDSCEEIICCNRKSVAILTYSKTVLSHSLNVNHLQSLNDRFADSDEILDVVCLSSNPQSKFVTGATVGGVAAILTLKSCIILSSRPKLSVLFTVSLNRLFNKIVTIDGISIVPSITWLIFNNGKRNVNPLLLISVGNRIRFVLCTTQNVKNAPLFNCANLGTLTFPSKIRCIHMITRLIFLIVDFDNFMHIVQINLLATPIYYDIIRSIDLSEICVGMGFDMESIDENWIDNILGNIVVHSKTVKMVAKGYKKFANLVTDLFQGRKADSSFDLKNISLFVSTPFGILYLEINSWIKVIGELVASKLFSEAIAIIVALSEELIPGLFDFTAFKNNLSQLLLYTLHQSSAHIIKLVKFINETDSLSPMLSINEIMDSNQESDDQWKIRVKTDVENQIKVLCNSMVDGCISLQLYDPLNKLVFRCFSTINLEYVFVKYILLNFYQNRTNLRFLDPQILESILDTYDNVLDYVSDRRMANVANIEDLILLLDEINFGGDNMCLPQKDALEAWQSSDLSGYDQIDPILLIYSVLSNNLVSIQLFCFKNKIPIDSNKAMCRLSKHHLWHALMYCQSDMAEDISTLMNIYTSEALDKCRSIRTANSSPNTSFASNIDMSSLVESNLLLYIVPFETSEKRLIIRVLFLALNTFLTFGDSGLINKTITEYYRNIISFLLSSSSQEVDVELPICSKFAYSGSVPPLKGTNVDYSNLSNERFYHDPRIIDETFIMYNLMVLSPRLFFVCFANLFINCDKYFESYGTVIGSKIDTFNFFLDNIISCVYKLESSIDSSDESIEFLRNIKTMLAMLILGTAAFTDCFFLDHRTQTLAIYTLICLETNPKNAVIVNNTQFSSSELTNSEGFFNNQYYHSIFSKHANFEDGETSLRNMVLKMHITENTVELPILYIKRLIYLIYSSIDRSKILSDDSKFVNIMEMCKNFATNARTNNIRVFLYEVSADFNSIFREYGSSSEPSAVFPYIDDLIEYMKVDDDISSKDTVTHLLASDTSFRKNVVIAIMNNLQMLISLDLSRVTGILVKLFSLVDIMKVFDEENLETSPDMLLDTLLDVPNLQLLILDSFLRSETLSDGVNHLSNSYFDRYLKLLSLYEKQSVCKFLKTQKILNIVYCLNICKENSIEDAVIYLLIRAGNIEEATTWLLKSFTKSIHLDVDTCLSVVETSSNLCNDYETQLSSDTVERFWFKMLEISIGCYEDNIEDTYREKICMLITRIFTLGILRFIDFRVTLTKIIEYDSLLVFFRVPLHNLICDFIIQTFIADNAVSISKVSLNNEFKESYLFSNRGIVVSTSNRKSRISKILICPVCKKGLGPSIASGVDDQKRHTKQGNSRPRLKGHVLQTIQTNNISSFEQKVGMVVNVPIYGTRNQTDGSTELQENTLCVKNLYNDRLSTFSRKHPVSKTDSETYKPPVIPKIDQCIKRGFVTNLQAGIPVKIFWCKHVFHQECAPTTCPICAE